MLANKSILIKIESNMMWYGIRKAYWRAWVQCSWIMRHKAQMWFLTFINCFTCHAFIYWVIYIVYESRFCFRYNLFCFIKFLKMKIMDLENINQNLHLEIILNVIRADHHYDRERDAPTPQFVFVEYYLCMYIIF